MRKLFLLIVILVAVAAGWRYVSHKNTARPVKSSGSPAASSSFNKQLYSLTDPTSLWVIVNKQHPLSPKDYVPADLVVPSVPLRVPGNDSMQLRKVTADAMTKMFADAKSQGIDLMLASGYRSYDYQVNLYNGYVKSEGQATADTQSARPGYSEHQTGLAADVEPVSRNCEVDPCFGNTPEGKWLATNAYQYGFIIRYTPGNQTVTGYEPEPWHIRYVGTYLSKQMHAQNIDTLEQFFGVSGGTVYKS